MEKNGMRKEGHLRECSFKDGEWADSLLYAILESEWRELSGKGNEEKGVGEQLPTPSKADKTFTA